MCIRDSIIREGRRKKAIRAVLADSDLIPADADGEWFAARRDERTVVKLRSKALGHLLSSRELARVLYSFASHRGYIDHGKSDNEDDAGKVKKALAANHAALADGGCATFGQYLAGQPRSRNRAGDYSFTTDIDMTVDEVRTIFARQRELGSEIATEALEERYIAELTWLTDTSKRDMSTYLKVGFCTYLGAPHRRGATSVSYTHLRQSTPCTTSGRSRTCCTTSRFPRSWSTGPSRCGSSAPAGSCSPTSASRTTTT